MADCCDGLKEALSKLESAVNQANQKLTDLGNRLGRAEGDIKKLKQGGEQNNNESEILKRLNKIETYCGSVEQYLNAVTPLIKAVRNFIL